MKKETKDGNIGWKEVLVDIGMIGLTTFVVFGIASVNQFERQLSKEREESKKLLESIEETFTVPEISQDHLVESTPVVVEVDIENELEITESDTEPEVIENTQEPEVNEYKVFYSESDAIDIAKVLYTECRGVPSTTEKACVAWTVLNRADRSGLSISEVIRSPEQFAFYEDIPVDPELLDLSYDVLDRWNMEKNGIEDAGRVLPIEYTYFRSGGGHNHFRNAFSEPYNVWDYSYFTPYQN